MKRSQLIVFDILFIKMKLVLRFILIQVCVAALDLCPAKMKLVNLCIQQLSEQFPSSLRVSMLEGLKFEYQEKWEEALEM